MKSLENENRAAVDDVGNKKTLKGVQLSLPDDFSCGCFIPLLLQQLNRDCYFYSLKDETMRNVPISCVYSYF